jgi:hypothetical protein
MRGAEKQRDELSRENMHLRMQVSKLNRQVETLQEAGKETKQTIAEREKINFIVLEHLEPIVKGLNQIIHVLSLPRNGPSSPTNTTQDASHSVCTTSTSDC